MANILKINKTIWWNLNYFKIFVFSFVINTVICYIFLNTGIMEQEVRFKRRIQFVIRILDIIEKY